MGKEEQNESLEEIVFKTLSNQKRRDTLRFIGERKEATFTEIKKSIETEDTSSLSYHLTALDGLVIQKGGKYSLSELGHDAYNLIYKTSVFTSSNSTVSYLRRELPAVIVANAILWAAAIFSVSQFEGELHQMTIFSFAALWFISNIILYSILTRIRGFTESLTRVDGQIRS